MSASANLIDEYNNILMSMSTVRSLMSSVPQNAQNETVDLPASLEALKTRITEMGGVGALGTERRKIIGWLNKLYFTHAESPIPDAWWWEMHTRIQKLLIVSMSLEGQNLRSFGVEKLEVSDIPQCLVHLRLFLAQKKASFAALKEEYETTCNNMYLQHGPVDEYHFIALYMKQ